jgi:hypothetical protein
MGNPLPALAAGGSGLRDQVNSYRASGGLAPVAGTQLLDDIATARAGDMAAKDAMQHDMAYVQARLDAAGVCWTGLGEIIAESSGTYTYGGTVLQWWNSPMHHSIMMSSSFNAAGGAWDRSAQGRNYSVMVFATLCGSDAPRQQTYGDTPFTDIGSSVFRNDIEWLYTSGITAGCDADSFCPSASVSRGQMASFLARALDLPATTRDYYADDNASPYQRDINRVAAAGIAAGCASGRFCPNDPVTRDQMASFLVRSRGFVAGAGLDLFDDDDGDTHENDIDRLAYSGVTAGCAGRLYCPDSVVNRGQMAAFLHRAFGG